MEQCPDGVLENVAGLMDPGMAEEAAGHHPDFAFLHYELARCAPRTARERLARALELDPDMRLLAADDPALGCLGLAGRPDAR
jgi:hypothetical protein